MTREEKIKMLKEIRTIDAAINQKIEELDEARASRGCIGAVGDGVKVQSSKLGDSTSEVALRIITLERYIDDMIDEYVDYKGRIMECIDALDDPMERVILTGRYIDRKTWERLADDFTPRISRQWLTKRHNDAVDNLVLDFTQHK